MISTPQFPPYRSHFIVMRTIVLATIFVVLLLSNSISDARAASVENPGSWWLNLRTTGYAYQAFDASGATTDRLESYQHISGAMSGLASGRLTLRVSARFADDIRYEPESLEASRLHAAQLVYRPNRRFRLELGRQFIQEGVASLTLDGARVTYKHSRRWRAIAWGGGRTPFGHGFDVASLGDDAVRGLRFEATPTRTLRLGLSTAYRKRGGTVAERPIGFECAATAPHGIRFLGRAAYDLELENWRRLEGQATWRASERMPELRLQLLSRRPSIDAASWFSRFVSADRINLTRLIVSHDIRDGFGGELEYLGTFIDDRSSSRIGLAALLPFGRVGWSLRSGDTGDEGGLYGEVARKIKPWLWAEGSASYLSYHLLNDDPLEDERVVMTLAGRLRARLKPGLQVTAEIQRLETPEHAHDVRLVLGVNLAAGGGASRFGLNGGGVRP